MKISPFFQTMRLLLCLGVIFFISGCQTNESPSYSRGVGVYPGNYSEYAGPDLQTDQKNYRNIAFRRAAYHSSSYDYNLTAQLLTDGIITHEPPGFIEVWTDKGEVAKNEREWIFNEVTLAAIKMGGSQSWLEVHFGGTPTVSNIDAIDINGKLHFSPNQAGIWKILLSGSNDGQNWVTLAQSEEKTFAGKGKPDKAELEFKESFNLKIPADYSFYRVGVDAPGIQSWQIGDFLFYKNGEQIKPLPSDHFASAWMSAGSEQEWVYVDLGAVSTFDKVKLHWISKPKSGAIQVSDHTDSWRDIVSLPRNNGKTDEITLPQETSARYIRILMQGADPGAHYILSEMEVWGKGGLIPQAKPAPTALNARLDLSGGNWKINRASEVNASGETLSRTEFSDPSWLVASVPGTALVSYWNAGAIPDPNFRDNQLMISESFFNSDFWYRNEFDVPAKFQKERLFLNFDGINWKAEVFVNGNAIGNIDGAFTTGKFDVTNFINPGKTNAIAVLIRKNDHPGAVKEQTAISPDRNGGILGADNPTFHASVGWDWISTIRGRNIGIWNDVFLSTTGPVTIEEPFVQTDLALPDTSFANIYIEVKLNNQTDQEVSGTLKGSYGPLSFSQTVTLRPNESTFLELTPDTHPELRLNKPELWWPKGYGKPHLYDVDLVFEVDNQGISDQKHFKSGVREMAFDETEGILSLYINGRRFIGRGGNWGFSESNLNYRSREYDIAVGYHADMNFTMIRNWVGQTGDDEFFEACDRHGIMVWQDFWLANPYDGPDPYDNELFMSNARNFIKRIRNHPSIAIYVGRNEGNPPEVLDNALRQLIPQLHPGIHYISHSSEGVVSGYGPYRALPVQAYYMLYGKDKIHSERGMPNVMTYESLQQTLPPDKLWPQNNLWGLHDYCLEGAQSAASFNQIIETAFGPIDHAKQFTELAQWINYDGYRGMFESRSEYRKGLLLWMSHPAWPSMVWQTYDYYFEPTAAYFACKKASEPLHIQWNPVSNFTEVVNYHAKDQSGLTARAKIINLDGTVQWEKDTIFDSFEDSTIDLFKMDFPESLSKTHFIKLTLKKGEQLISENFYWRGLELGNYQALHDLPLVNISHGTTVQQIRDEWVLKTSLKNTTQVPALMIRLKVVGTSSGNRILPVTYSDNYVSLMPGEEKTLFSRVQGVDARGEKPKIEVSGFNLGQVIP